MPARKNSALNKRHDTKDERAARKAAEDALIPKTPISKTPPSALNGHAHAREVWTRIVGLYFETKGEIITAFDEDVLIKYCLAEEELIELKALRAQVRKLWESHLRSLGRMRPSNKNMKDYFGALMQAVFAFWQLQNRIGEKFGGDATLQIPNAQRGLIHSHAGTGTYVTVSILERPS